MYMYMILFLFNFRQYTEDKQGFENFTIPDAMLSFCKSNNLSVRGHSILWDDITYQAGWVKNLSSHGRREAAIRRVKSVVQRYKREFIHWDVINENLHYQLFSNVTHNGTDVFQLVHRLDPHPIPFMNEYTVIEASNIIGKAMPQRYLEGIDRLRASGYEGPLGIGLEGHFDYYAPNIPYVRTAIDVLASTGLPIWITELTVNYTVPHQTEHLEALLHELHSHPAIKGIILWSAIGRKKKCFSMCLTDVDYKNVPAGDVVDRFMKEFINVDDIKVETDAEGEFETVLFYGEYEATAVLPDGGSRSLVFNLVPGGDGATHYFQI